MDVQELRPGLWRWTARHPEWEDREVSSAYLETADAVVLLDPLVPRGDAEERFFRALDRDVERLGFPVAVVLTNPWHRRSSDELAQRYDAHIHVAAEGLPTGFDAYPGGMQPEDFVVHVPALRVLFTGDTIVDGEPCPEDWLAEGREHQFACLRRMVDLDADLIVPSHGEPFPVEQLARALH
jgi:glyoxylase-like metal-dependent hydrolase (beta-lactamase superfamily II)